MTQIIAVSKPTKNVLTATDPNDFIFHSDYDTLKYAVQGTVQVVTDQADFYVFFPGTPPIFPDTWGHYTVVEVEHNLGYVPYFAGYLLDFPSANQAIQAPFAFGDFVFFIYLAVYADANKLYFVVHFNSTNNSGNVITDFSYRIFKNSLGL